MMRFLLHCICERREYCIRGLPWIIWFLAGGTLLFAMGRISVILMTEPYRLHRVLPPVSVSPPAQPGKPIMSLFQEANAWSRFHIDAIDLSDPEITKAPASALAIRLTGILHHQNIEKSLAIIERNTQQSMLLTGDKLPGADAEIARIFKDRIIILHQGKYESIAMEREPR